MMADINPDEVRLDVPHVPQDHSWDCGLACTQMVLRHSGKTFDDFDAAVKQGNFGESVWTIDLAHLLRHYRVNNHFTTIMLGVDKDYSKKSFYRSRFSTDQQRVDNLFKHAAENGLSVEQRSVDTAEIVSHLVHHRQPLIVLTDCSQLTCQWCNRLADNPMCSCFGQCIGRIGTYQGHFIVVCGYNKKDQVIYYKNPAYRKQALCCCTIETFDRARKAHGTDQDIIFIFSSAQCTPSPAQTKCTTPSVPG